ncbi:GlxA family transcriptional regulator [Alteromonas sediminis]|uniref:GlxA family transcriptional regulator n=1 Tax=Alteromonas sediminis TaxID=2259342 RepID=UPI0014049C13|nr:helix-turn-helix domain-containing protein [Alteromonas sediminis]
MSTKIINILASNSAVGSSLIGIIDFVQFANTFWQYMHPNCDETLLAYRVYANEGDQITLSNGLTIPAKPLSDYEDADAVFLVSSFVYDKAAMDTFLKACQAFKPILQRACDANRILVSYCTGTFGLASCGVLENKRATTVWWMSNLFVQQFPNTTLTLDELVIVDGNVITGGATTSYFNVCLRLLEMLSNEVFAIRLSKLLLMDRHRLSQQAFIESGFIINKHDELVEEVQNWMMNNFASPISLDVLCDQFAVTKRTLIRRFKASCNETPLNYLQKIRVEKAKHYLETTNLPVERIVERVGYEDAGSFRKLFTGHTQLTPKAYRERFTYMNRDEVACCD